jgi:exodeoxyribonuclease V gamma subunit
LQQLNPLLSTVSRLVASPIRGWSIGATGLLLIAAVARVHVQRRRDRPLHDLVPDPGALGPRYRHRALQVAEFTQNPWSAGLDRLLIRVAMDESEERFIGTALPMDDVDSSDVDLIGRLAECVDRIRTLTDSFAVPKSLPAWCDDLKRAISATSVTTDSWQVAHAYAEISALAAAASDSGEQLVELAAECRCSPTPSVARPASQLPHRDVTICHAR